MKEVVNRWVSAVLVFCVAFLCYISSLDGGFVFDDHRGILTNDDLDSTKTSILELFQHDFWGGSMSRKESHKSYRPLTVLTYRYLNYYYYQLEPYSYHVVNVLFHCVASVLFLFLCQKFLSSRVSKPQDSVYSALTAELWPTVAALLFAAHSVHTEAVASVVGRAEVISCIFFLLSLLSYMKAVSNISLTTHSPATQTRWLWVAACIALCTCSLLSKEQGVSVLGVCAGYDVFLNWEAVWSELSETCTSRRKRRPSDGGEVIVNEHFQLTEGEHHDAVPSQTVNCETPKPVRSEPFSSGEGRKTKAAKTESPHSYTVRVLIGRVGILVMSGMGLLWFRLAMNYNSEPIFKPYELRAAYHSDRSVRALSFSNIYTINSWLLLSPSTLCCDWSLSSVPLVTTLTDTRNVWSALLYLGLLLLVVHTLRSKRDRLLVGMGLMLLLLPFLPASGLVFRVGFVVAERVLYMPSLGSCLLVTIGAKRLANTAHKTQRYLVCGFLLALLLAMGVKTHERNKDWETDFKLFESGVKAIPMNVKIRNNYGMELKDRGRIEEAKQQYKAAMLIDPEYGEVYFNYGNLLSDENDFAAAAEMFEKAITFPQMYGKTLNNLATMYFRLGRYKEAENKYIESLQRTPDQASTYNNLASLFGEMKRYKESESMFKKALELSPTYVEAIFNLGTLYVQMGQWDAGERELRRALKLNPSHHGAMNNLKVAQHYKQKSMRH